MNERPIEVIDTIITHCSASDVAADDDISAIRRLHMAAESTPIRWGIYNTHGKAYDEVGYNFFIRKDGLIQVGRDVKYIGAHCIGQNYNSIGVCFSGDKEFTKAQFISFLNLKTFLLKQYGIDLSVKPHNAFSTKPCPGFILEGELEKYDLLEVA